VTDLVRLARQLLPNLPADVFDGWLIERIEAAGWPPRGARWNALLGGYSVQDWSSFTWTAEDVDLHTLPFAEDSIRNIVGLSQAEFSGIQNAYSSIENSRNRMSRIYSHINETKKLPGRVVLIASDLGWEIIDGCHRITMYEGCLRHPDLKDKVERLQPAWVARGPGTFAKGVASGA